MRGIAAQHPHRTPFKPGRFRATATPAARSPGSARRGALRPDRTAVQSCIEVSCPKLVSALVLAATLLIGCGGSAGNGGARSTGGAILPASWDTGLYSACPADVGPSGFSGIAEPNCHQGSYANSQIPLPPGPWSITIYVPNGCSGGSNGEGGTFARVPPHGWTHVEGVSAAACGNWSGTLPPGLSGTS